MTATKNVLSVLVLEDRPEDAELMVHALRAAGFDPQWQRVDSEQEYLSHLDPTLDLILADYRLPGFDALRALALLQVHGFDIPFIIVSGTIGEELAVEALKQGAIDYLLKDRLGRLGAAVGRALNERRLRDEERRAEQALHESEERLRQITENIQDVIWMVDAEGKRLLYINPVYEAVWRRPCGSLYENLDAMLEAVHPDDERRVRQAMADLARGAFEPIEYRIVQPDGAVRWIRHRAFPIRDSLGQVYRIAHIAADITTRRDSEEALRRSEERYRSLYTAMREGVAILELVRDAAGRAVDYRFIDVNPACESIVGLSSAQMVGPLASQLSATSPPPDLDVYAQVVATRKTLFFERHVERTDRQIKVAAFSLGEHRLAAVFEDVTERARLERDLRQAQKMEAIGQFAGGIAHDFNNLLTAILGYADIVRESLPSDSPWRAEMDEIEQAAHRAADLTRQLLAFSRRQILQPIVLDLNAIVSNMDRLIRRLLEENRVLVANLGSDLGPVKVDPGQIEQIIANLVVNARDAMPEGGKLTIETANVELDDAYARGHAEVRPGSYVMLAVSDTGMGMDADTQARIFDPFFTTKPAGRGTGLGLATVYGIVKQSGGHIWVYSEPGRGTTFKVYLPRVDEPLTSIGPVRRAGRTTRGSETVLLVEDDEGVRELVCTVLERSGYRVLHARNGVEAMQVIGAHEGSIHLLITDVVMPEMGGRALAEQLAKVRPETRILFMSGYTSNAIVHHGVLDAGVVFLEKPFTPDGLVAKVRAVLDANNAVNGS